MEQFLQGNIPLRHLLNAETLFMSWRRSAIKDVNDWAKNPLSSCRNYEFPNATNPGQFYNILSQSVVVFKFRIDFRGGWNSTPAHQTIHFPCWKISLSRYVNILILAGCYIEGGNTLFGHPKTICWNSKKWGTNGAPPCLTSCIFYYNPKDYYQ